MKSTFGFVYNQKVKPFRNLLLSLKFTKKPVAQVKNTFERTIASTPDLPTKKTSATVKTEQSIGAKLGTN